MTERRLEMRNIEPLPSGSFRLRMQHGKRKLSRVFATVEEAIAVRDGAKRALADEIIAPVDGQSLLELGPKFLKRRDTNRSVRDDRSRWEHHISTAPFARVAVSDVQRIDVLDWLDDLKTRQIAYDPAKHGKRAPRTIKWQTRKHCLNLLRRFFAWCMDRPELKVTANPCEGITVEREDGDEEDGYQEGWYLTVEDQQALIAKAHEIVAADEALDIQELDMILFALGTGLRLGEQWCLALESVHVDGDNPRVDVVRGSWDAKNQRYRTPKGRKGTLKKRTVPLFGLALDAARRWAAGLPRFTKSNKYGLFFPSRNGGRRTKHPALFVELAKNFELTRLGRRLWWHLLRHSCASSLVAGWWGRRWSMEDVRAILGHSSVTVTERYAHLVPKVVEEVAVQAQAAWLTRCHAFATTPKIPLQVVKTEGLRSRRSQVRILPDAPALSPPVVATSWQPTTTPVERGTRLVARVADGEAVTTREWLDVVCDLLSALRALAPVEGKVSGGDR